MGIFSNQGEFFDPAVEARAYGEAEGRRSGTAKGLREGKRIGFNEGHEAGYEEGRAAGWADGMKVAHDLMDKQKAYTFEHYSARQALAKQVEEQRGQIQALEARIAQIQADNAVHAKNNAILTKNLAEWTQYANTLKEANAKLQAQVAELNKGLAVSQKATQDLTTQLAASRKETAEVTATLQEKTKVYNALAWKYNALAVFAGAVRETLEEAVAQGVPNSGNLRIRFMERYDETVKDSVARRQVRGAPHLDEDFAKSAPKARQFILDMLEQAPKDENARLAQALEDDQALIEAFRALADEANAALEALSSAVPA